MSTPCDAVIVGGGPVGATLALALHGSGLSVTLLEARNELPGNDRRSLALSYGTRLILERLGAWDRIAPITPIETIHVSQRGGVGRALLRAADAGVPALGYVASYGAVHQALIDCLAQCSDILLLRGARASRVDSEAGSAVVHYQREGGEEHIASRLAVLADGGVLAQQTAGQRLRAYGQSAVVAIVTADRPHHNRAFERFTAEGPVALLPTGNGYALIWTAAPITAEQLCTLDTSAFLERLQAHFGDRAGRFTAAEGRAAYPLSLRVASGPNQAHVVLLGNAAQTLHPVAGQGLNLGLRDAWELAQLMLEQSQSLGSTAFCTAFCASRRADRTTSTLLTDALVRVFSNDLAPLRWLRGCGLTMLDSLPPAKREFMDRMMFGA